MAKDTERDWPEDFAHDNGCYQNRCCRCDQLFMGFKRRITCKLCAGAAPMTPEPGRAEVEADFPDDTLNALDYFRLSTGTGYAMRHGRVLSADVHRLDHALRAATEQVRVLTGERDALRSEITSAAYEAWPDAEDIGWDVGEIIKQLADERDAALDTKGLTTPSIADISSFTPDDAVGILKSLRVATADDFHAWQPTIVNAADALVASLTSLRGEVERLTRENDQLKYILAKSGEPCIYCGLATRAMARCESGFPGCARADDLLLTPFEIEGLAHTSAALAQGPKP